MAARSSWGQCSRGDHDPCSPQRTQCHVPVREARSRRPLHPSTKLISAKRRFFMSSVRLAPEREHTDVFTKHRGPVTCAVAVPRHNGSTKEIVSSGYDGAVAITDVTQQTMTLVGYHDHLVNRIAL